MDLGLSLLLHREYHFNAVFHNIHGAEADPVVRLRLEGQRCVDTVAPRVDEHHLLFGHPRAIAQQDVCMWTRGARVCPGCVHSLGLGEVNLRQNIARASRLILGQGSEAVSAF